LARALAQLAALGYPVNLALWDQGYAEQYKASQKGKKPGMTIPLTGANYFKRPEKRAPLPQQPATPVASAPAQQPAPQQQSASQRPSTPAPQQSAPAALPLADASSLQQALQITRQSMQALQDLQQQTAQLHQQFLAGQESTTRSFLNLVEQQNRLLQGQPVAATSPVATTASPVAAPQPTVAPAPVVAEPVIAAPVAATPAPIAAVVDNNAVASTLLAVIAEKTGYPVEMLELEMTLDADLGIDSIKRVEILSALQEQLPEAPAVKPEDLGTLQTLGQIIDHLSAGMTSAAPAAQTVAAPAVDSDAVASTLLTVIAEKTGYPVEMLELEMTLDADLGIDSIKRVEILSALQEKLPEAPSVKPEDLGTLQTLGQIIDHLSVGMTAAPAAQTVAAPAVDSDAVASTLLAVIAEKTGYPVEMLELEMTLDADLGIDSIKRVEILSALQEQLPEAPAVKPEDLGTLQTLGQIIDHLSAGMTTAAPAASVPASGVDSSRVAEVLLEVIADKTGYPQEMLELGMALDTDLGIDSIKRVEILSALQEKLPGAPAIKPEHLGTLQTVGQIVDFLASVSGASQSGEVTQTAFEPPSVGSGVERKVLRAVALKPDESRVPLKLTAGARVWVCDDGSAFVDALCARLEAEQVLVEKVDPAADSAAPTDLVGLIIPTPQAGADKTYLGNAFLLLQKAGVALNDNAATGAAFFATVSRLDGRFGLGGEVFEDTFSGGLAGLSKTAGHEWPQVSCRAFDLGAKLSLEDQTEALVTEILNDGAQEVGITESGLYTLELVEEALSGETIESPVGYGDVVAISGGARGVTAEVAVTLAASSRSTLLLLGRSAEPQPEAAWLEDAATDAQIKQAIIANSEQALKPKQVGDKCQKILAEREIRNTLQRIKEAGGQPLYRSVDLRDAEAVAAVIADVRAEYGPIKGLIHGAGVLADRLINDKTAEQFEQVFSTKIDGLNSLLNAVADDELKFMVMFSSSTGRYGRTGQVDYAVANEVLNKQAQRQALLRPDCRVLSLNWGPWDGGMVTPELKKLFAAEGVAVIDLKAGADYMVEEIATPPGGPVELVILGGREEAAS
ncbi:MAG: SDR family NAD(P)-dependent oxidoreductase, partial [Desulfuromonadales bacterium]|nr:SDR family NAD(P)-dependent oxidoreductase [Desulfuromonadales bacterium]